MKKYFEFRQCNGEVIRINNRFYWDKELGLFFKANSIVVFDDCGRMRHIGQIKK